MLEASVRAHGYLFLAALIILIIFLVYVYLSNHRTEISQNNLWQEVFQKVKLNPEDLTHDDTTWYFQGRPTCVAYGGSFEAKCPRFENYCAGGGTYGDPVNQALAIKKAIENGGEHPLCPLVYPGAP